MARQKHTGTFESCDFCKKYLEFPFGRSPKTLKKDHDRAIAKRERDQAMRDMGLVKVRGNLGGTYWK